MFTGSRFLHISWSIFISVQCLGLSQVARANEPPGPPVRAADAAAKVGLFQLKLTERSPLSKMSDVATRMGVTGRFDYDLPQEVFTVYIPKTPAADGKFGLMVSLHFREYGYPAPAWTEVLEKYHIVWIGPQNSQDGRAATQRIGLMLDATHNARKIWPIDDRRTYACVCSPMAPDNGVALAYPEVFQGDLHSLHWTWIEPLPVSKMKGSMWTGPIIRKPDPALWELARTRSRFYIADRSTDHPGGNDMNEDVANEGYLKSGFKYVKFVSLDPAKIGHYVYYTADWFEEGVQFLDAPLADPGFGQAASAKPVTAPPSPASAGPSTPSTRPAAPPAPAIDDKAVAAEKALSLAKSYLAAQNYSGVRSRLEKLIQSYPSSRAAKEAEQILHDIAGK